MFCMGVKAKLYIYHESHMSTSTFFEMTKVDSSQVILWNGTSLASFDEICVFRVTLALL